MSSRIKFILLFFTSFGTVTSLFYAVLLSDWARRERAWFQNYPLIEMAQRLDRDIKPASPIPLSETIIEVAALVEKTPEIMPLPAPIRPLKTIIQKERVIASPPLPPPPVQKRAVLHMVPPDLLTVISPPPPDHAQKGYTAYNQGNYEQAAEAFLQALAVDPQNRNLMLQLAYSYKHQGRNNDAGYYFRAAIDENPTEAGYALKSEVQRLENTFDLSGYLIFRDQNDTRLNAPLSGPNLLQSQIGLEGAYRVASKIQFYGRLLGALNDGEISFSRDSTQAGVGLRYRPLENHNLVLSAERLVAVGDFARNDWMLRADYSLDLGPAYREDRKYWWSATLYLDSALIHPTDPDIFLTFQGITRFNWKIRPDLILRPHFVTHATWQKDSFRTSKLVEAGPGISFKFFFNDSTYTAWRAYLELVAEYRFKLAGNSLGRSGPVMSFLVHF